MLARGDEHGWFAPPEEVMRVVWMEGDGLRGRFHAGRPSQQNNGETGEGLDSPECARPQAQKRSPSQRTRTVPPGRRSNISAPEDGRTPATLLRQFGLTIKHGLSIPKLDVKRHEGKLPKIPAKIR